MALHRKPVSARKVRNRTFSAATAADGVGPIAANCEIYGITDGKFNLIDIILHILNTTGPAHLTVATWSAATQDTGQLWRMHQAGELLSLRYLLDVSFPNTKPEWWADLKQLITPDQIRMANTHAKFVLIRNSTWNIAIRTSANLNRNIRMESYEISDCAALCDHLETFVSLFYDQDQSNATRSEINAAQKKALWDSPQQNVEPLLSAEPFGRDIRRVGLSFDL